MQVLREDPSNFEARGHHSTLTMLDLPSFLSYDDLLAMVSRFRRHVESALIKLNKSSRPKQGEHHRNPSLSSDQHLFWVMDRTLEDQPAPTRSSRCSNEPSQSTMQNREAQDTQDEAYSHAIYYARADLTNSDLLRINWTLYILSRPCN